MIINDNGIPIVAPGPTAIAPVIPTAAIIARDTTAIVIGVRLLPRTVVPARPVISARPVTHPATINQGIIPAASVIATISTTTL